jgi:hypothetical protein
MKTSREYIKEVAETVSDLSDRRAAILFCHLYNKSHEAVAVQKQIDLREKNLEILLANMIFAAKREVIKDIMKEIAYEN